MTATDSDSTTEPPIRWSRIVLVALAGVVSHTFGRTTLAVLVPAMGDDLELSSSVTGALGSVNLGFYFVGVVVVTFVAGRIEPFILLRSGIGIVLVGLAVLGTANSTAQVLAGTALAGLGGAGIWLTVPIIATEAVPAHRRGSAMGALTATMGAAFIVVPLAVTGLREVADDAGAWREIWLVECVGAAILLVTLSLVVRPERTARLESAIGFGPLFRLTGWRPAVATYMSFAFVASSFSLFAGPLLEDDHGFSRTHATLLFSAMGAGSLAGAMFFGRMSDRWGRPRTMFLAMSISGGSGILILVGSEPWALLALMAFGASSFSYPTLTATFVRDQAADREFTAVFGAMTIFYGPASIAGPIASGSLADATGNHRATYLMLAAVAFAAAAFATRLPRVDHSLEPSE